MIIGFDEVEDLTELGLEGKETEATGLAQQVALRLAGTQRHTTA